MQVTSVSCYFFSSLALSQRLCVSSRLSLVTAIVSVQRRGKEMSALYEQMVRCVFGQAAANAMQKEEAVFSNRCEKVDEEVDVFTRLTQSASEHMYK